MKIRHNTYDYSEITTFGGTFCDIDTRNNYVPTQEELDRDHRYMEHVRNKFGEVEVIDLIDYQQEFDANDL